MRCSMVLDYSPQKQKLREDLSLIDLLGDSRTMSQREGRKEDRRQIVLSSQLPLQATD